jgi:hypothetical protein
VDNGGGPPGPPRGDAAHAHRLPTLPPGLWAKLVALAFLAAMVVFAVMAIWGQ